MEINSFYDYRGIKESGEQTLDRVLDRWKHKLFDGY